MTPGSSPSLTELASTPPTALISHQQSIPAQWTLNQIYDAFPSGGPSYLGVVDGTRLIGICSRAALAQVLGARYGVALFGKRSVQEFLLVNSLIVRAHAPVMTVLDAALSRSVQDFNDDVG